MSCSSEAADDRNSVLVITSSRDDAMKNKAGIGAAAVHVRLDRLLLEAFLGDFHVGLPDLERLGGSLLPVEDVLDFESGDLIRVGCGLEFGLGGQIGVVGAGRSRTGAIDLGLGHTKGWTGGGQGSHQNQDQQQRHPPARESAGHRRSGYQRECPEFHSAGQEW